MDYVELLGLIDDQANDDIREQDDEIGIQTVGGG